MHEKTIVSRKAKLSNSFNKIFKRFWCQLLQYVPIGIFLFQIEYFYRKFRKNSKFYYFILWFHSYCEINTYFALFRFLIINSRKILVVQLNQCNAPEFVTDFDEKKIFRRHFPRILQKLNPLKHNVPKWSDTLCLTILGHYALKG